MDVVEAATRRCAIYAQPLAAVLFILLLISAAWNLHQYKLLRDYRRDAIAAGRKQRSLALAEAQQRQAARKAEQAAADARLQQLYREIDTLSQINEHILAQPLREHRAISPANPSTDLRRER
jgi:hypothetical protein